MSNSKKSLVQFEYLPVPCMLIDESGNILAANILAQEHLNTSEKRMKGKSLGDFIGPKDEVLQMMEQALQGSTVSNDSFYTQSKHKPYSLHFSKQAGKEVSVVLIAEGNRLEAEAQSRRFELAEAVSRVALENAHEIKNPLAALRGATQLLSEQLNDGQLEIVQQMLKEIDRIKERVDGFLQVGPRANVQMETVSIHALIDDVSKTETSVKVQHVYDPSIPDILLHERRFRQALENLWSNALEAEAQHIIWETRIAHGIVLPQHKGAVVAIKILSDGNKIPDHIQERLFEPYVTGKERGSGLGLSIVQQVVQEHGGKVICQSENMRTSFTLYLPLRTEEAVG